MEEMHRTHKEPGWGWVAEVALIARAVQHRRQTRAQARPLPIPMMGHSKAGLASADGKGCR